MKSETERAENGAARVVRPRKTWTKPVVIAASVEGDTATSNKVGNDGDGVFTQFS